MSKNNKSNDDRSNSMNRNNDACKAAMDNRSDQMNQNNKEYPSSSKEEDA